ncbi:MAG: winged helix-turn-helix domain-containing protein [Proteobacteria bacterium]|nr:winged helix-turn-helix domain-containing protein [Pseudomonadota bacterium]
MERRQYEFSGYRLDALSRELFGPDGAPIAVTSKALDVLVYLIKQRGRVVDKNELLAAVWAGRVVEENNLTQAISALRKAFGTRPPEHRYIVTVPGRGYRFVADLAVTSDVATRDAGTDTFAAAERLYLAGRDLIDAPSLSRAKRAIGVFRQVLDIEPRYARAWSGQAFAWRALTITGDMDPKQAFPLAKAAVQHALALDPDLPEAHAAHAFNLFWNDWDWCGAELACKHAISLDPRVPDGHFVYAHLLNNLGRFSEALSQARQARELEPLAPIVNVLESGFLAAAGRTEEASMRIAQALEIAPDFWVALLGRAAMAGERGDPAAVGILEQAAKLSGRSSQVLTRLGPALVATGDRTGAEQLREELRRLAETTFVPGASRAAISNALGYSDEALDLLELAYEQRDVRMTFLKINACWNNLRPHPRFVTLMDRMGFTAGAAHWVL